MPRHGTPSAASPALPWLGGRGRLLSKPAALGSQPTEFLGSGEPASSRDAPGGAQQPSQVCMEQSPKNFFPKGILSTFLHFSAWQRLENIIIVLKPGGRRKNSRFPHMQGFMLEATPGWGLVP